MDLSSIHHLALTVTDLDRSVAWYCDVLGFVERFREEGDGRRACILGFASAGTSLGLVQHRAANGVFDPTVVGLDHAAFVVTSREELDEWVERLDAAGVEHSGATDVPPGAILNFKDPDGIALALFWDR